MRWIPWNVTDPASVNVFGRIYEFQSSELHVRPEQERWTNSGLRIPNLSIQIDWCARPSIRIQRFKAPALSFHYR